ncbi:hypothetical protein EYV94_17915 [Puteibacter caeruleilacunae]|nr:hypothetical protein EYV94_17915 [Puteibacter caeruleilacunae]
MKNRSKDQKSKMILKILIVILVSAVLLLLEYSVRHKIVGGIEEKSNKSSRVTSSQDNINMYDAWSMSQSEVKEWLDNKEEASVNIL